MAPAAGIGRYHEAHDLAHLAHSVQDFFVEEAECRHADQEQREGPGRHAQHGRAIAAEARKMMRMARAHRGQVDLQTIAHQRRPPMPISRWRTMPVSVSMIATVMTTSNSIADTSE